MNLEAAVLGALTDKLRAPRYRGDPNPLRGHCYVASEALWHLSGGKSSGLKVKTLRHEGDTHWYLTTEDGTVVDLTASQFKTTPDYAKGRGIGFLTLKPSKRAQAVMENARAAK